MSQWILTYPSGQEHFVSGAEVLANEIDIYDVAWALAQTNRFTGHAKRAYSVAEHSLLVADLAAADGKSVLIQQLCLMHDGHEFATGDVSSPVKIAIGLGWAEFEARQADRFRRYFHLAVGFAAYRELVNHYDLIALATERKQVTCYDPHRHRPWPVIDTPGADIPPASHVNLNSLDRLNRPWQGWRDLFLQRYFQLQHRATTEAQALMTASTNPPITKETA